MKIGKCESIAKISTDMHSKHLRKIEMCSAWDNHNLLSSYKCHQTCSFIYFPLYRKGNVCVCMCYSVKPLFDLAKLVEPSGKH